MINEDRASEFWNRDDEESCSEEEISDPDDGLAVKSIARSKLPTKLGLAEKIDCLQRLEEKYYQNESSNKQNVISDTLREATKQRLRNALNQAHRRLGNLRMEVEKSASFLENECYNKYGKNGKYFYYSLVASTVRWLSTADSTALKNCVGTINGSLTTLETETPAAPSPVVEGSTEVPGSDFHESVISEASLQIASPNTMLPPIPSF